MENGVTIVFPNAWKNAGVRISVQSCFVVWFGHCHREMSLGKWQCIVVCLIMYDYLQVPFVYSLLIRTNQYSP
jgi:hypothetical protein